ncbi:MAG TPA: hypothetical protein GX506_05640 [Firmicutes bacterium]|nr:hypothetical protein [Bacillota bacterium]
MMRMYDLEDLIRLIALVYLMGVMVLPIVKKALRHGDARGGRVWPGESRAPAPAGLDREVPGDVLPDGFPPGDFPLNGFPPGDLLSEGSLGEGSMGGDLEGEGLPGEDLKGEGGPAGDFASSETEGPPSGGEERPLSRETGSLPFAPAPGHGGTIMLGPGRILEAVMLMEVLGPPRARRRMRGR